MNTEVRDSANFSMSGETIDRIYNSKGELVQEIHSHNLVVNSFTHLITSLLKNRTGFEGVQYWAVGSGDDSWDDLLPNPDRDDTRLMSEIGRVPISSDEIHFIDPDLEITTTPTNKIQIVHTFGYNDCNGIWREFGIFGGNATETENSGIMINKRHHEIITKTTDMMVERTLRFTFNLV